MSAFFFFLLCISARVIFNKKQTFEQGLNRRFYITNFIFRKYKKLIITAVY